MGGGAGRVPDVPESYWDTFDPSVRKEKEVLCAHCNAKRKDDGKTCPGCGSREVKNVFRS